MNVAAALPIVVEITNTKFDEVVLQSCPHLMGCGKFVRGARLCMIILSCHGHDVVVVVVVVV